MAKKANMGLNIDAEEAARLDLSLDIIEKSIFKSTIIRLEWFWRGSPVIQQENFRCNRLALCFIKKI